MCNNCCGNLHIILNNVINAQLLRNFEFMIKSKVLYEKPFAYSRIMLYIYWHRKIAPVKSMLPKPQFTKQ